MNYKNNLPFFYRHVSSWPSETFELVPRVALVDRVAREKRTSWVMNSE